MTRLSSHMNPFKTILCIILSNKTLLTIVYHTNDDYTDMAAKIVIVIAQFKVLSCAKNAKEQTRKLPSWAKGLLHRHLTATTLISANGTGMELPWLLAPEVVCMSSGQLDPS